MDSALLATYQEYPGYNESICDVGVPDCLYLDNNSVVDECSNRQGTYSDPEDLLWTVVLAGIMGGLMCFGIGANDAANAWATAVGSGALPLRFAVVLGGFMEWAGAMVLGFGPAKTVTKGTAKIKVDECFACGNCDSKMTLYGVGMLAALCSASLFLLLATFSSLPVSTTHAIIGATVGATVTSVGFDCLNWKFDGGLGGVIASWFISPVFSGILGIIVYFATKFTVIYPFWDGFKGVTGQGCLSQFGLSPALVAQPIIAGTHTFIILLMTMLKTPQFKGSDVEDWEKALYAFVGGLIVFIAFLFLTLFWQKHNLPSIWAAERELKIAEGADPKELDAAELKRGEFVKPKNPILALLWNNEPFFNVPSCLSGCGKKDEDDDEVEMSGTGEMIEGETKELSKAEKFELKKEQELKESSLPVQDAHYCFKALLIYNAVWDSFAHGANDTGNATGAFAGAYNVYTGGDEMCKKGETPVYIMAIAGAIMFVGIVTMGQFVIKTIGSNLAFIDYHIGFCVEMASTIAVILASILDLPVSTTHCQVGAIVFIGLVSDYRGVSWKWFGAVSGGWLLTVPIAALISAAFTAIFREAVTF